MRPEGTGRISIENPGRAESCVAGESGWTRLLRRVIFVVSSIATEASTILNICDLEFRSGRLIVRGGLGGGKQGLRPNGTEGESDE